MKPMMKRKNKNGALEKQDVIYVNKSTFVIMAYSGDLINRKVVSMSYFDHDRQNNNLFHTF